MRLKTELYRAKDGNVATFEYQTEDHELSFQVSAYNKHTGREELVVSYSFRRHKRRVSTENWSNLEDFKKDGSSRHREADLATL